MRTLHYYPQAPYSRKVLLAAHEKQIVFEKVICPPHDVAAKQRLRVVHPLATVPLLVDGDAVLTESSIIVEHFDLISDRGPRLISDDRATALRQRALDRFSDAHVIAPSTYIVWTMRKPPAEQNVEKMRAERAALAVALGILDAALEREEFVAGEAITIADMAPAASVSCMLMDGVLADLTAWPSLARWYDAMIKRPSFLAIFEECATVPLPPGFLDVVTK